jgi:hypothetical protein
MAAKKSSTVANSTLIDPYKRLAAIRFFRRSVGLPHGGVWSGGADGLSHRPRFRGFVRIGRGGHAQAGPAPAQPQALQRPAHRRRTQGVPQAYDQHQGQQRHGQTVASEPPPTVAGSVRIRRTIG